MRYLNKVRNFSLGKGYVIRLIFRDGFEGEVDLWPLFEKPRGPLVEPFGAPAFFQMAFLDHGTLSWPNGYDICSDVLRYYCEIGHVCSDEELNAVFNPEANSLSQPLILKDKPPT